MYYKVSIFFEEDFELDDIKRNFEFYEPLTVHESSLSPCVHAILASSIGHHEKAYEMYLRTARLDLDDYNNDTEDGCHITSMAGTWMAIVKGFAGMRIKSGKLHLQPNCPAHWEAYNFKIKFRDHDLQIEIMPKQINIFNQGPKLTCFINDEQCEIGEMQVLNQQI